MTPVTEQAVEQSNIQTWTR